MLVLIYVGVVTLPATLYLYLVHSSWSWMYMVDPADVPALAVVPMLVLHGGCLIAGWYVGSMLLRGDRIRAAAWSAAGGVLVWAVLVLVLRGRLGAYGSYMEFHDGRAANLLDVKLGYVLLALVLALSAATGYTAVELLRDSRRVRSR